ncbi:preprotein translocase subunit YajC [Arthrobacter livingstonensis]|uniref:Preprotein translocase subunit YajC n=1 Tax=Arthrobacter livingstonensis TaxID=670078 RepID=A0A2V5L7I5_9MICC|nr:preprotein translocase subunit YajC [Arthrobacter livingstonensis]
MNGTFAVTLSSILAADQAAPAGGFNPMNLVLFALFALLIIMMIRKQRKTKAAAQEKQSKLSPGVDIMTNFGLFGHVKAVDTENNKIELEISPGVVVTVHSQTVAKIIDPADASLSGDSVPDDVSSLTLGLEKRDDSKESAEETLARLNQENNKDN